MLLEKFDKKYLDECLHIWNEEVGFIFPISKAMFEEKTVSCRYFSNDASFIIKDNDKVIGYVISKIFKDNPNIPKYQNVGWISLLFVKRNERKKGYGNILLTSAEEKMKELGVSTIMVGSDIHNFFPGIPNDFDNTSDKFFQSHGYEMGYYTHDLIKKLSSDDLIKYSSYNNNEYEEDGENKKVLLRYANINDKDALLDFLKRVFFGRWYDEGIEYFSNGEIKKEYLLALVDDKVVGFLRVNNGLIK